MEEMLSDVTRYSPALVRYTDTHVVVALRHQDIDIWQLYSLFVFLHRGSHRVLEQFEENVVKMGRRINQLDWFLQLGLIVN